MNKVKVHFSEVQCVCVGGVSIDLSSSIFQMGTIMIYVEEKEVF